MKKIKVIATFEVEDEFLSSEEFVTLQEDINRPIPEEIVAENKEKGMNNLQKFIEVTDL